MMRILVTGDRGYIGTVLAPFLRRAGHEVVGLDAGWYDGCDFGSMPDVGTSLTADVRDVTPGMLEGFDAVIHLAAISNDPIGHLDPGVTFGINTEGTLHVARAAKAAGVGRFVFASSCSLYGSGGSVALAEDAAFQPVTPYGESKVRAEQGLSALADDDFSPTYMRNATAYGSSPRLRADIVVNNLTGTAFCRGEVRLQSDGSPWRPLVHIEDISRAVLAALQAPREKVHDEAFNVGVDRDVVQVRDIANQVSAIMGCGVTFAEGAGADVRDYRVDFSKIHDVLDFDPQWSIDKGIRELATDMSQRGLSVEDFEGPRFVRLERVRQLMELGVMSPDLHLDTVGVSHA
ncbi:SDR family oxidoreductase [Terrabacter aerolatus]|uniref:NAD-dependent dehydratase n=1 Tax=Terrabacter aerolatus TaxID=422442 RepID=A0A512D3P5_9MICO|nr:SDR family oxidoreductase [Terrabacter aerolatus]GEO31088.1 NAD-dependent dehydratase [Terrabacter aerolatus]